MSFTPPVVPTTVTVIVQVDAGAIDTLATFIAEGAPLKVGAPHPEGATGVRTTDIPAGSRSLNPTPVSVTEGLGFRMLNTRLMF